jgi:hypothetical protein
MRPEDLLAFARRDWGAIGRSRLTYWAERYSEDGGVAARRAATQLYEHARRLGHAPPDERRRADDLADHVRLRDRLDRAARALAGR